MFELAWREYFHHCWDRLGDAILSNLRDPPGAGYRDTVPPDLRAAATGVVVIDQAVHSLYSTGYLHNRARMWLASYAVHLRKVHWRAGADWMIRHLLDGDIASNHLSWQWVAGTLTGKPYLFNADNVARYAPAWASAGTVIDRSYQDLEAIACGAVDVGPERHDAVAVDEPPLLTEPPEQFRPDIDRPLPDGPVTLVHPWSLSPVAGAAVGIVVTDYHGRWPWSALRWRFVLERMRAITQGMLVGASAPLAAALARRSVTAQDTRNAHYRELLLQVGAQRSPTPRFFANPPQPCRSFSQFWHQAHEALPR